MVTSLVHLDDKTVSDIQHAETNGTCPYQKKSNMSEGKCLMQAVGHQQTGFVMYFIAFLIIGKAFEEHARMMTSIPRVKLSTVAAHLFGWFPAIAFVPSTLSFMAAYFFTNSYVTAPFFGNLAFLVFSSAIIHYTLLRDSNCALLVYSRQDIIVGHPELLSKTHSQGVPVYGNEPRRYILLKAAIRIAFLMVNLAVTILVSALPHMKKRERWWLFALYGGTVLCSKFTTQVMVSCFFPSIQNAIESTSAKEPGFRWNVVGFRRHQATIFDKSRLEAFADGVFGITATLIVLEIKPDAEEHHLPTYVKEHKREVLSAAISLLLIVYLWHIHATLVSLLEKSSNSVTHWTYRLNFIIFAPCGLLPFITSLVTDFPKEFLPVLLLGQLFIVVVSGFLAWLVLESYHFKHRLAHQRDALIENDHSGSATSADSGRERASDDGISLTKAVERTHFNNMRNQVLTKLFLFGSAGLCLTGLGVYRSYQGPADSEWVITSLLGSLFIFLLLELVVESVPRWRKYFEDDMECLEKYYRDHCLLNLEINNQELTPLQDSQ